MYLTGTYSSSLPIEQNLSISPEFAQQVLSAISKQWYSLINSIKTAIFEQLKTVTCIPTQKGMKKPSESYLNDVKMFPDLPVVNESVKSSASDEVLVYLGVRKTIELKYVMERLHSDEVARKWSPQDMIIYLASQQKDMQQTDISFLKANEILASENDDRLHNVNELYQPTEELRELGLHLLKWCESEWNPKSTEALFLFKLGLNSHPSVATVISLAANAKSDATRNKVLRYFIQYFDQNKYRSFYNSRLTTRFLPATIASGDKQEKVIVSPSECFSSPSAALFEFPVLQEDLQAEAWKFGVELYPRMEAVIQRLIAKPPTTLDQANKMFTFMAGNISELKPKDVNTLRDSAFIPIFNESGMVTSYRPPSLVFIESTTSSAQNDGEVFYSKFFDFVSFNVGANAFLRYCGARDKPSILELARITVAEPNTMYVHAGGFEKYIELLIQFERKWAELAGDVKLVEDMKTSPFLLGRKFSSAVNGGKSPTAEEEKDDENDLDTYDAIEDEDMEYVLARASEIVINDDVVYYNFFKAEILSAPFDSEIERLYKVNFLFFLSCVLCCEICAFLTVEFSASDLRKCQILYKSRSLSVRKSTLQTSTISENVFSNVQSST